jgi:Cytidine and deoxycytidylate deaminase zinc-binding region
MAVQWKEPATSVGVDELADMFQQKASMYSTVDPDSFSSPNVRSGPNLAGADISIGGSNRQLERFECGMIRLYYGWEDHITPSQAILIIVGVAHCSPEPGFFHVVNVRLAPGNRYLGLRLTRNSVWERLKEIQHILSGIQATPHSIGNILRMTTAMLEGDLFVEGAAFHLAMSMEPAWWIAPVPIFWQISTPGRLGLTLEKWDQTFYLKLVQIEPGILANSCANGIEVRRWTVNDDQYNKTFAYVTRHSLLPPIITMSGHTRLGSSDIASVSGDVYTARVLDLVARFPAEIEFPLSNDYNRGVPGRYYACHAELQAVVFFLEHHRGVPFTDGWLVTSPPVPAMVLDGFEILVTREPCGTCDKFLRWASVKFRFWLRVVCPIPFSDLFSVVLYRSNC